jgi:hypothetical protein
MRRFTVRESSTRGLISIEKFLGSGSTFAKDGSSAKSASKLSSPLVYRQFMDGSWNNQPVVASTPEQAVQRC